MQGRSPRLPAALALIACLAVATLAQAQEIPDPSDVPTVDDIQGASDANQDTIKDSEHTPHAKDGSKIWRQVGGTLFPMAPNDDPKLVSGSPTAYSDNLFDVAFLNDELGLAGGATCGDSDPDADYEPARNPDCRPVAYIYADPPDRLPFENPWQKLDLPGADRPGFIGAIAWIDTLSAMLVGGTGTYPRREPPYGNNIAGDPCEPPSPDGPDALEPYGYNCDQAGSARAWLYRDGELCELGQGSGCPDLPRDRRGDPVRGLTAADFRIFDDGSVLGFVGGLGQISRWQGIPGASGRFDKLYDNASPTSELEQPPVKYWAFSTALERPGRFFRFRVRDIRFAPTPYVRAYAVTSGCCSSWDTSDSPLVLTYTEHDGQKPIPAQWTLRRYPFAPFGADLLAGELKNPTDEVRALNKRASGSSGGPLPDPGPQRTPVHQSGLELNDSFYSLVTAKHSNPNVPPQMSIVATAASTDSAVEQRSYIIRPTDTAPTSHQGPTAMFRDLLPTHVVPLSTARVLAIDGIADADFAAPDWGVGELRSRQVEGRGRQGFVWPASFTSQQRYRPPPRQNACPLATVTPGDSAFKLPEFDVLPCDPQKTVQEARLNAMSGGTPDYVTTSYTLNSLDMIGDSGLGWAVGDHGAIVRIGGSEDEVVKGGEESEPRPPRSQLGLRREAPLPERGPYESPDAAEVSGVVPALAAQPKRTLAEPQLVNAGAPDATHETSSARPQDTEDVAQIVMSRDGSEGWAIGPNPGPIFPVASPTGENPSTIGSHGVASFYHYARGTWTRCDPVGIRGQLPPDRACASVAGLRRYMGGPRGDSPLNVRLVSVARIPFENDSDPTNDDRFEVVALGGVYRNPDTQPNPYDPAILRYRNGEWGFEDRDARAAVTSRVLPQGSVEPTFTGQLALKDIAFTAPDDGWILGRHTGFPSAGSAAVNELYHYDGESWQRCRLAADVADAQGGTIYHPDDTGLADCGAERIPVHERMTGINAQQMRMGGAGDRVYLYGNRRVSVSVASHTILDTIGDGVPKVPFILYHERGGNGWTDGSGPGEDGGGWDPGYQDPKPGVAGNIASLSVAQNPDGSYSGWAVGYFFDGELPTTGTVREPAAVIMRLDPESGAWERFRDRGALEDHMWPQRAAFVGSPAMTEPHLQSMLGGTGGALVAQNSTGLLFAFDRVRGRWETVAGGRPSTTARPNGEANAAKELIDGHYQAIAPDNQGGFWLALKNQSEGAPVVSHRWLTGHVFFSHYTASPPEDVFRDTAHPFAGLRPEITALDGTSEGSVWVATDSALVGRYDRATGWQTVRIPGWDDESRFGSTPRRVNAIGGGPGGSGVVVGEGGRIASLTPKAVQLDEASGVVCEGSGLGPGCGTNRELRAVSVAPDGSALAGGDAMVTLWRPPGGPFQRIADAPGGTGLRITGISMPAADRAWLTVSGGFVLAGKMSVPGEWSWRIENKVTSGPHRGMFLGALTPTTNLPLRAIAIGSDGRGYAVGDRGLVLERIGDSEQPWRRLRGPGTDNLTAVTLAQGEGGGALIGGRDGVVWTASRDRIEVARPTDYFPWHDYSHLNDGSMELTGSVIGMALLPGVEDGQAEAWIAIGKSAQSWFGGQGTSRLLHYASDRSEPLLDPSRGIQALPDVPPARDGEISFAAFGKSDCQLRGICSPMSGTVDTEEVTVRRIVEGVSGHGPDAVPDFALLTGDVTNSAGATGAAAAGLDRQGDPRHLAGGGDAGAVAEEPSELGNRFHSRFSEWVADPLERAGAPLFGAIGPGDLSRPRYQHVPVDVKTGDNVPWRYGFAAEPAPWGAGENVKSGGGLVFESADGSRDRAQELPEQEVDPDFDSSQTTVLQPIEVRNGARTHYAADIIRDEEPVARLVVVDSSLRSLTASDGVQNPLEVGGGQLEWLERMLCFSGQLSPGGGECTRERAQQAIVLSNTPTYTYAPIDPNQLAPDATVLESVYLKYSVSAVVSGRLGWNGLYYALQPGLHTPCPGGPYPEHPPEPGLPLCQSVSDRLPVGDPTGQLPTLDEGTGALGDASGNELPSVSEATGGVADIGGMVPFVVASGAGGKFGPNGENDNGAAADGFWHGYTIVRLSADGDPRKLVVEQRPILDWVGIQAIEYVLSAREKLRLKGVGREPIAFSRATQAMETRYVEISTPAITHRFDLVLADPERPWVPCSPAEPRCAKLHSRLSGDVAVGISSRCAPYLCLPDRVATIDSQSGEVEAGNGKYPDTFAVAILSVGDHVASYPLLFKKSPSFVVQALQVAPAAPAPPQAASSPPQPPAPPSAPNPNPPSASAPAPPPVPVIAPLQAAEPPEPQPPAPPAPPPPSEAPAPISLTLAPPGIAIATPTAVIQPPTPPVNPAPPGGARREARQRQAAAQKSGADSEQDDSNVDKADAPLSPTSAAFSRHDHAFARGSGLAFAHRDEDARRSGRRGARTQDLTPSFTPIARADQPSAWAQGALYTGGMALVAFALAAGFSRGGPTPRRRTPEVPAPATAHACLRR